MRQVLILTHACFKLLRRGRFLILIRPLLIETVLAFIPQLERVMGFGALRSACGGPSGRPPAPPKEVAGRITIVLRHFLATLLRALRAAQGTRLGRSQEDARLRRASLRSGLPSKPRNDNWSG